MFIRPVFRFFETWIKPFGRRDQLRPPESTLSFIWFYVGQAKGPFAAMAALGGAVALLEAALFWFVGRIVDVLDTVPQASGWNGLLVSHGTELAAMVFVVLVVRFLVVSLSALVEEQTVVPGFLNLVRWQAYAHVSRQSLGFFHNDLSGRIVSKVWSAGQSTSDLVVSSLQVIWFIIIYAISTVTLIAGLDARLALVVVVWIGIFALLARYFVPRIRRHARSAAEMSSVLNGQMVDAYSNIQVLKLFGREERNDRYILNGFERFQKTVIPFTRLLTGVRASLGLLSGIMITTIAVFAIDLWLAQQISAGGVALTLSLVLRLSMLFGRMMAQFNSVMRNFGTIQNAAEMIAKPVALTDRPDARVLTITHPDIRFEQVSFGYGSGKNVLDHLSLTIRAGEKVGVVGRSGAGKTTLMNVLLRFYDLTSGRILINDQDIALVTQESLRQQIGVVTQDAALLHRSIRDNILFGRPDADEAQLLAAVLQAEADRFIEKLVDQKGRIGFDAHVGERGVKLSGGQRQRIAIARVMLKNAPILVLDEATSALDSEVEAALQSNLEHLMRNKTVLAIAHRLSTIAAMDRLIVLDEGKIVEQGTHSELIAQDGLYAALWARQSGDFIDAEAKIADLARQSR